MFPHPRIVQKTNPRSARYMVQLGPAKAVVKSKTRMDLSGGSMPAVGGIAAKVRQEDETVTARRRADCIHR
jgi:ribosomal protein L6P/L9E